MSLYAYRETRSGPIVLSETLRGEWLAGLCLTCCFIDVDHSYHSHATRSRQICDTQSKCGMPERSAISLVSCEKVLGFLCSSRRRNFDYLSISPSLRGTVLSALGRLLGFSGHLFCGFIIIGHDGSLSVLPAFAFSLALR